MKYYRGRLFDHIRLNVRDIKKSRDFYRSVTESLGLTITAEEQDHFYIDELGVFQGEGSFHKVHFAFQAQNPAAVKRFHETALMLGGKCNGEPAERKTTKSYFSAFVLDPDGNNLEVIYHGPIMRSAPHIEVHTGYKTSFISH